MNKNEMQDWLIDNLPDWPKNKKQLMNIPSHDWHWWMFNRHIIVLHVGTGEFISHECYLKHRDLNRLRPCGMSFSELLKDLCD